jgi:hypothetical protein
VTLLGSVLIVQGNLVPQRVGAALLGCELNEDGLVQILPLAPGVGLVEDGNPSKRESLNNALHALAKEGRVGFKRHPNFRNVGQGGDDVAWQGCLRGAKKLDRIAALNAPLNHRQCCSLRPHSAVRVPS